LCLLFSFIFLSRLLLLHAVFHVAGNCNGANVVASMNLIMATNIEVGLRTNVRAECLLVS
jgi:hypothetical protein